MIDFVNDHGLAFIVIAWIMVMIAPFVVGTYLKIKGKI